MAWTPRTWIVGEVVTAAMMNTELRDQLNDRAMRLVTQAADMPPITNNSTTFIDTDLHFDAVANATYVYWCVLGYSTTPNSDMRWIWSSPSGGAVTRGTIGFDINNVAGSVTAGGDILLRRPSGGTQVVVGGKDQNNPPTDSRSAFDLGYLTTGATAGTFTVRVCQGTAHADQLIFRAQSMLAYQRVA